MSRLRNRHWRPTRTAGNLAGLDQPVDRAQVDLEVLQDFLGRQKRFVNHSSASSAAGRDRQLDREDGAAVRMVGGDDLPAVLLHDAVGDRQPQARALADLLGRVERLEDARQRVGRNAVPGVAHRRDDPVAGRRDRRS